MDRRNLLITAIVFLVALGFYSLQWFNGAAFPAILGDVAATSAERVLAGDIPYRDFWSMYAPGSFYLLAFLFTLLGHHILVSTVAGSVLSAVSAALCYRLAFNLTGGVIPGIACSAVFFSAFYMSGYGLNLGPYPPVIVCVLAALIFVERFHARGNPVSLYAAGIATGLAIVFKHDVGGYAAIAISAGIVSGHFVSDAGFGFRSAVADLLRYAAGAAVASLPLVLLFAVLAGPDMWRDLVVFPLTDFPYARPESYPGILPIGLWDEWWVKTVFNLANYVRFNLPLLVAVAGAAVIAFAALKKHRGLLPIGVTFALLFLFHYSSAHVQINTNLISMPLYATLLGAAAFTVIDGSLQGVRQLVLRLSLVALAGVLFSAFAAQPAYLWISDSGEYVSSDLPKIHGIRVPRDQHETLKELAAFVDENFPEGRRIFIGLHRHDTTVIGDGSTYFILDRLNATRQDQLHPGIVDTARVQREMISDLGSEDVRFVFLKRDVFSDEVLDELRKTWTVTLPESGSTELDEYIRANYSKERTIGQYEIWKRLSLHTEH